MSQLNIEKLTGRGIVQIVATCQLLQESFYLIADVNDSAVALPHPPLCDQVFIPFIISITGICVGRKEYLGEFGGYICWYQPNYAATKPGTTMEDVALTHTDTQLYDFTASIMRDNGQIQKQWCLPGEYFVLLTTYKIEPLFRSMGIGTLLFDQLHHLIQKETCVPIRTVFIPPPTADDCQAEALMTLWRRLGYKEIGRTGRTHQIDGYFARGYQKKESIL